MDENRFVGPGVSLDERNQSVDEHSQAARSDLDRLVDMLERSATHHCLFVEETIRAIQECPDSKHAEAESRSRCECPSFAMFDPKALETSRQACAVGEKNGNGRNGRVEMGYIGSSHASREVDDPKDDEREQEDVFEGASRRKGPPPSIEQETDEPEIE